MGTKQSSVGMIQLHWLLPSPEQNKFPSTSQKANNYATEMRELAIQSALLTTRASHWCLLLFSYLLETPHWACSCCSCLLWESWGPHLGCWPPVLPKLLTESGGENGMLIFPVPQLLAWKSKCAAVSLPHRIMHEDATIGVCLYFFPGVCVLGLGEWGNGQVGRVCDFNTCCLF